MAGDAVLFKLCLVWMLITVHGVKSLHPAPTITPSGEELVVNLDETLTLDCYSPHGPVTWEKLPQHTEIDLNDAEYGYQIEKSPPGSGKTYSAKLTVENAQNFHTGYYTCVYEDNDDSLFAAASKIYVYAFDKEKLIVEIDGPDVITVKLDREAVVPCRPTSPKVKMTLLDSLGKEMNVDGNEISFNPKVGFTLMHPQIGHPQVECKADLGENTREVSFTVHVYKPSGLTVAKPSIEGDLHAVVNRMFTLNCSVDRDHGGLEMRWFDPSGTAVSEDQNTRIFVEPYKRNIVNNSEYAVLTLTVRSANKADNGTFRCEVENSYGSQSNAEVNMHILGEGQSFITLVVQGNKTTINAREGIDKSVQWIVDIHAHPKPSVRWIAHNGLPVSLIGGAGTLMCDSPSSTLRYGSTSTDTRTKLTVCHPKVSDTGVFDLEVGQSDNNRQVISFFLNVSGAPEVFLRNTQDQYPEMGQLVKQSCSVVSNPKSNVRWIFTECDFRANEECLSHETRHLMDTVEVVETDTVVHSDVTFTALRTGLITCEGCNRNVSSGKPVCTSNSARIIVSDLPDGFGVIYPDTIIEGDEQVNISCAASVYIYNDTLSWKQVAPIERDAASIPSFSIYHRKTNLSHRAELVIEKAHISHSGTYQCKAERSDLNLPEDKNITLTVLPVLRPEITDSSFNQSAKISTPLGVRLHLECKGNGRPDPDIIWLKDHLPINETSDRRIRLFENNTRLVIARTVPTDEGNYECRAFNRAGEDARSVHVVLSHGISKYVYIGIVVLGIILLAVIVYLCLRIRKEKKQRKRLMEAGLLDFEKGAVENLDPHLPVDEQAERLPYDPDFEFPRNKLKLGKVLGSGAFGVVLKGEAYGILHEDEVTPVAVKMVKRNADGAILRALTSELKILIHMGRHLNVVNLLGACTKCINKMELLIIVEYCRYGNLQNYLLRHRKAFVNQVDPSTGQIDYSIRGCHPGDRRLKYATLSFHSSAQSNSMGDDMKDYHSDYGENLVSGATDVTTVSMTPTGGQEESSLMSNNSNQPEWRSNYRGDYKDNVEPITTEDLVCFAFQVARGMEYLASRKILHGDLAARNILLADNKVVKICDFGLARTMYKDETYRKKENGLLPIKWMAIESLRDRIFSTQSDVWSFGIVLWEFFSLSRTPYPGTEPNQTFLEKLEEGYRMEKPPYAPEEVYELMMSCWRARPTLRPSFSELGDKLGALLNEDVRNLYTAMNQPYIEKNNAWMEGPGRQDYLAMMNAPVYDNMTSPLPVDDDPRISSPLPRTPGFAGSPMHLQDGYVVMRSPSTPSDPRNIFSPTRLSGTNGGTVFKFCPPPRTLSSPDEEHVELRPMLSGGSHRSESTNESDTDAYLQPRNNRPVHPSNKFSFYPQGPAVDSFSNPSYLLGPSLNTSKDNYINYPQPVDNKHDGYLWPRSSQHQIKASPTQHGRPELNSTRPVLTERDLVQDVTLPPSYINIPSQRRGFALPNNDDVTYANLR